MGFWEQLFGNKRRTIPSPPQAPAMRNVTPRSPAEYSRKPAPQPIKAEKRMLSKAELVSKVRALCDSSTRKQALSDLQGQPAAAVIEAIQGALLSSSEDTERWRGVTALENVGREFGWPETVRLLESSLDDSHQFVVGGAVKGLVWVTYHPDLKPLVQDCATRRVSRLVDLFRSTTDLNYLVAFRTLLPLAGPDVVPHLQRVLPTLKDKYQIEFATETLEAFRASPTQSKGAILESLASPDVARRKKACYESIHVGDREVVEALIRVLRDFPTPEYNSREDVYQSSRKGAAYALGKIADPFAIAALREAIKKDGPWGVQKDGTLVRAVTGMPAFGTSVREGLTEADTEFARSVLGG